MSYETFRASFCSHLPDDIPIIQRDAILAALDVVSTDYDIQHRHTDLIVYNGIPEALKLYVASKSVENLSKNTLTEYYRALVKFFQTVAKPYDQITANDVRVYLHQYKLEHHVQDNTLEGIRIKLNSFYSWCVDEEMVAKNPVRRMKPIKYQQKPRQPMTQLELEIMRKACRTLREKALVDVLYSTAARVSEVAALHLEDIDMKEGIVRIRHGKGDKARTTYLNPEAIISLQTYLATRTDDCPAVFCSIRKPHHQLTKESLEAEVRKIKARTDITKKVTPHVFRHTTTTTAIHAGMPVQHVQQMLGHSRLDTTMIYAHDDESDVRASHAKYVT